MEDLGFDQTYMDRTRFEYYESGHMAYLNQTSARRLRDDIVSFTTATQR
jgi:carboxypeptidase C (cathepsin A)